VSAIRIVFGGNPEFAVQRKGRSVDSVITRLTVLAGKEKDKLSRQEALSRRPGKFRKKKGSVAPYSVLSSSKGEEKGLN